ncbi:unnamed protein product [Clonostachys byssicola]|uniref:Capsule synthesis protein CapA domain-containing protein n=1 Tax=Clonostachys byssicola TaxID=160290 RepID=A0A9N9UG65_9HYPO|nr:unnamed protein product [Clonostachys byssicola]
MPISSLQPDLKSSSSSRPSKSWSIAATGDLLGDFIDSADTDTLELWDLVRSADHAFFNMEGQVFRDADFDGYPASENGADNGWGGVGWGPTYNPDQVHLLASAGFNLASLANNHAWDYEVLGMTTTRKNLRDAGIHSAGCGLSLAEAQQATYVDRNGVHLALVCAAGSHTPQSVAGPGNEAALLRPRPGVNVVRAKHVTVLNESDFSVIRNIAVAQGQSLTELDTDITLHTGQHPLFWSQWRRDQTVDSPRLSWDINQSDLEGLTASIREAKTKSDGVIFSFHAHESESGTADASVPLPQASTVPASYVVTISKAAVDAGASTVLVHGPHHLRGIEIYKGRPVFYGVGHLTYSLGRSFRGYELPIEWDDGIIASINFTAGALSSITLQPTIHSQLSDSETKLPSDAMPKIAPVSEAQRILEHLRKVSSQFGTVIKIERRGKTCIGVVDLAT